MQDWLFVVRSIFYEDTPHPEPRDVPGVHPPGRAARKPPLRVVVTAGRWKATCRDRHNRMEKEGPPRIRIEPRNPLPARRLHPEHLQPAPRAVQAQRVPQGHPADDGAAALRLPARPHQGAGARTAREDRDEAGDRRPERAAQGHRASLLRPLVYWQPWSEWWTTESGRRCCTAMSGAQGKAPMIRLIVHLPAEPAG